jgi:hypothetical protein
LIRSTLSENTYISLSCANSCTRNRLLKPDRAPAMVGDENQHEIRRRHDRHPTDGFPAGTQAVAFSVQSDKNACYRWIQGQLVTLPYLTCSRQDIGVVIRYLAKVSGYSRVYLDQTAAAIRDTVAAKKLNAARKKLFQAINRRSKQAA